MDLLRLENIYKSYKPGFWQNSVQVLSGISFSVSEGRNFGLVGHSGVGKTTIAKIIAGLIAPDSGTIFYNSGNGANTKVQMVFQDYTASLDPRMSARSILREPYLLAGLGVKEADERLKKLLPKVGIEENWLYKYPHQFSGGQKQRLAITRAIALNPKLVILDEPFSSQDVLTGSQILKLLKQLQKQFDLTYLLISHDLALVKNFCKDVFVLKGAARETRTPTP